MANRSALSFHFTITFDDDSQQIVDTIPFDTIMWERKTKQSFASESPTIEQLMWVAWLAARRQHLTEDKLFDDWARRVVGFDTGTDDDTDDEADEAAAGVADPTQPEA